MRVPRLIRAILHWPMRPDDGQVLHPLDVPIPADAVDIRGRRWSAAKTRVVASLQAGPMTSKRLAAAQGWYEPDTAHVLEHLEAGGTIWLDEALHVWVLRTPTPRTNAATETQRHRDER